MHTNFLVNLLKEYNIYALGNKTLTLFLNLFIENVGEMLQISC